MGKLGNGLHTTDGEDCIFVGPDVVRYEREDGDYAIAARGSRRGASGPRPNQQAVATGFWESTFRTEILAGRSRIGDCGLGSPRPRVRD